MMKKIKSWLCEHFLPLWAKETVLQDNKLLHAENEALQQKVRELESYIEGLHAGMKNQRRIVINTGEVKK